MDCVIILIWCLCTAWSLWAVWRRSTSYWTRRGVKQLKPGFLGHVGESLLMRKCEAELYSTLYRESEGEPAIGVYKVWEPTLLVRSPQMMKDILIKEFSSFSDNDIYWESNDVILKNHPFTARADRWKYVRSLASPAVTPSKIKKRMPSIVETCKDMVKYIRNNQNKRMEAKMLGGHFTTDASMRTIYGVMGDSFVNPNSLYRRYNQQVFNANWAGNLSFTLTTYFPKFSRLFKIGMTPKEFQEFYLKVVEKSVNSRRQNKTQGNDYIQYLIDLNSGLSVTDMFEHSLSMLWDGYSTSSIVIGHCLDLLSYHPSVQDHLRSEIDNYIQTIDDITYSVLESMPYLHAFMSEVLRVRTPIPILHKVCTKKTVLRQEGRVYPLFPGDRIVMPIWSVHNDPHHFEKPTEFLPERFLQSTEDTAYLPFGLGPRTCMGMKFGLAQTKACVIAIIKHFQVTHAISKPKDRQLDPKSTFFLIIRDGIWVKFTAVQPIPDL